MNETVSVPWWAFIIGVLFFVFVIYDIWHDRALHRLLTGQFPIGATIDRFHVLKIHQKAEEVAKKATSRMEQANERMDRAMAIMENADHIVQFDKLLREKDKAYADYQEYVVEDMEKRMRSLGEHAQNLDEALALFLKHFLSQVTEHFQEADVGTVFTEDQFNALLVLSKGANDLAELSNESSQSVAEVLASLNDEHLKVKNQYETEVEALGEKILAYMKANPIKPKESKPQ